MGLKTPRIVGRAISVALWLSGTSAFGFDQGLGSEDATVQATAFVSDDWRVRLESLDSAFSLGWEGRDLVLVALSDRAEVISRLAQAWFVDQGEPAVHYLVNVLVDLDQDRGLYASIVDGIELDIGRSVSGTLWLTLARGLPRTRAAGLMAELVTDNSARVRSVAIFTAGTLRDSSFVEIVGEGRLDRDPLVRRRYREALVRLLTFEWYTTPDLDEATTGRTLDLVEPELRAILEDETPARFLGGLGSFVIGDAIGTAPLRYHRTRLISMLEEIIPTLSPAAAARAGAIIVRQAFVPGRLDFAPNSLWDAGIQRDGDVLKGVYTRLTLAAISTSDMQEALASWAALSAFPPDLLIQGIHDSLFESEVWRTEVGTWMAIRFLSSADAHPAIHPFDEALTVVERDLRDPVRVIPTTVMLYNGLVGTFPGESTDDLRHAVRRVVESEADLLYELARTASTPAQCSLLGLLIFAGDDRYFSLFREAWSRRPDPQLARCLRLVSRHGDQRLIPLLLDYIEASEYQDDLKAASADALLRALLPTERGAVDEQWITRLLRIAANAEVHPRTRATLARLVELPNLSNNQRKAAIAVILKNTQPGNEYNLRAKSCRSLGNAGVVEAKAPCMALTLLEDAPYWVAANAMTGISALARRHGEDAGEVVSILSASLIMYPIRPKADLTILQPANYYHWGVIYAVHPAFAVYVGLREATGQDFGLDLDRWQAWESRANPK